MGKHVKVGEPRQIRRLLLIDRLPAEFHERIRARRIAGRTWREIERESSTWKEWQTLPEEVRRLFAVSPRANQTGNGEPFDCAQGRLETGNAPAAGNGVGHPLPGDAVTYRLPQTNLHRWYDLRIEQTMREQQERAIAAHAAADKCAARGFTNLTASVKHALGEAVFELMNAGEDPEKIAAALTNLGHLLAKLDRNDLKREEVGQERQKIQLLAEKLAMMKGSVKGLKEAVAKKEVTPEQLQQKLDEIYGIGA